MLNLDTRRRIDSARDILVGKVPDPKAQVEQITTALIYKFMDDMDKESEELGGEASFFVGEYAKYGWSKLLDPRLGGFERLNLYVEALEGMPKNPHLPPLFRDILKGSFLPYRDPETLNLFLKEINGFSYEHSEKLGDAYEYLLSVLGSQGDAGQFRTPRHIIDFIVEVIDPKKTETILDPACGTAGFLISGYKHILKQNSNGKIGDKLTPDEKTKLMSHFIGYDISPDMVRLSLTNMYLHSFPNPNVFEYDSLTSEERWDETYDVIMANPPFMSPKGGIRPHKRFSIPANRSEVLFVDYIAEHLNTHGRAGVIVPEGIIFQSGSAYKALRKMLVEKYLYAVVSLPGGVFQPYSGVKTSILLMDKQLAKRADTILFVKVENDGYDLGAQRRPIDKDDLPQTLATLQQYKQALQNGEDTSTILSNREEATMAVIAQKIQIAKNGDYSLSGERYKDITHKLQPKWPLVELGEVSEISTGTTPSTNHADYYVGTNAFIKTADINNRVIRVATTYVSDSALKDYNLKVLPKGTVLMAMYGQGKTRGQVGLLDIPASITQNAAAIQPKEVLDSRFLFYYLLGQYEHLRESGIDGHISHLNLGLVNKVKIPIPPIDVQQSIVAELESYQKVIDGAKQVVENYKPRISVPPDCEMVELGNICQKIQYGISEPMNTEEKGFKIFRMHEMKDGVLVDNGNMKFVDIPHAEYLKYRLNDGDILFNRTNSYELVGRTGIFKLVGEYCFASYLIRLVINKALAIPDYINFFMNTDYFQTTIKLKATQAIGQANINARSLAEYKIPLPTLDVQEQIIKQLEAEQRLVYANKELIEIFEHKVKGKIAEIWVESEL